MKYLNYSYILLLLLHNKQTVAYNGDMDNTNQEPLLSNYLFVSKQQIKTLNISEIKRIYNDENCYRESWKDSLDCFILWKFENGKLSKEVSFDGFKSTYEDALNLAYTYYYEKNGLLSHRYGDAYNGHSRQDHINDYIYENGELKYEYYKEGVLHEYKTDHSRGDTTMTYYCITTYHYNDNGKIDYYISKSSEGNDDFVCYYIYQGDDIIVYYPIIDHSYPSKWNESDTIYNKNKIEEIQTIGSEKFSEKYFHGKVLKKIIDDCYGPIKNEQLFVNGKPIKDFLFSIGRSDVRYIIFEVTDNYFLFYKIID